MAENLSTTPSTPPGSCRSKPPAADSVQSAKSGCVGHLSPSYANLGLTTPSPSPRTPRDRVLLLPKIRKFEDSNCTSGNSNFEDEPNKRRNLATPYLTPPRCAQSPSYPRCALGRTPSGASTLYQYKPRLQQAVMYSALSPHAGFRQNRIVDTSHQPRSISFSAVSECIGDLEASYDIPSTLPNGPYLSHMEQMPPVSHTTLASELLFDSYAETPSSTTLFKYLTASNPSPSLVQRSAVPRRATDTHFWWDVRNIRPWSDFSIEKIETIPGFTNLLQLDVPSPALPTPPQSNPSPVTTSALLDIFAAYYAVKLNAALKLSLGSPSMVMRVHKTSGGVNIPRVPDFMSSYDNPPLSDIPESADPDAIHVIGLVRPFDQWNTSMREGPCVAQITFLRELSHLQHQMRSRGCRYGFIMTEIELVCVRLTTDVSQQPVFGTLEIASPVQLAVHSTSSTTVSSGNMTACVALWYLHMLAKRKPLPGQPGWQFEISTADQLSRRNCQPRDAWIKVMQPESKEKRTAKRNRGWVWPEDALSRKECGRTKQSKQWKREETPVDLSKESGNIR